MTITEIVEYLVIGIIAGGFATVAPVVFGHGFDAIMSIFHKC